MLAVLPQVPQVGAEAQNVANMEGKLAYSAWSFRSFQDLVGAGDAEVLRAAAAALRQTLGEYCLLDLS